MEVFIEKLALDLEINEQNLNLNTILNLKCDSLFSY